MYQTKKLKRILSFLFLSFVTAIPMILLFSEFSLLSLTINPTLNIGNDHMALAFKPTPPPNQLGTSNMTTSGGNMSMTNMTTSGGNMSMTNMTTSGGNMSFQIRWPKFQL